MEDFDQVDTYMGDEVQTTRGILTFNIPVIYGIFRNWDDMEKSWHLHANHDDQAVCCHNARTELRTVPDGSGRSLSSSALCVAVQAVVSLYASGRAAEIVWDSGEGVTHTVPIYDGHALSQAVVRLDIASHILSDYVKRILALRGYIFTPLEEHEIMRDIKEKLCHVALDLEKEMQMATMMVPCRGEISRHYFNRHLTHVLEDRHRIIHL